MDKFRKTDLKPNKFLMNAVLEAAIRQGNTDRVYDAIKDCVTHKILPSPQLLGHLADLKSMPDRLFVLLRQNFNLGGRIGRDIRVFDKPTFNKGKEVTKIQGKMTNYKKYQHKKNYTNVPAKVMRQVNSATSAWIENKTH